MGRICPHEGEGEGFLMGGGCRGIYNSRHKMKRFQGFQRTMSKIHLIAVGVLEGQEEPDGKVP